MLHSILRLTHFTFFGLALEYPILCHNRNIITLCVLVKIGALISWKFHRGCIITTLENKIMQICDSSFDYHLAQARHIPDNTPYWLYGVLSLLITHDLIKLYTTFNVSPIDTN